VLVVDATAWSSAFGKQRLFDRASCAEGLSFAFRQKKPPDESVPEFGEDLEWRFWRVPKTPYPI
jgi:hypothetical protein